MTQVASPLALLEIASWNQQFSVSYLGQSHLICSIPTANPTGQSLPPTVNPLRIWLFPAFHLARLGQEPFQLSDTSKSHILSFRGTRFSNNLASLLEHHPRSTLVCGKAEQLQPTYKQPYHFLHSTLT